MARKPFHHKGLSGLTSQKSEIFGKILLSSKHASAPPARYLPRALSVQRSKMKANMSRRTPIRILAVLALAVFCLHAQDTAKRGRKYKSPPPSTRLEITVVRDTNGKPIENAAVVFHPLDEHGKDAGNMELKTNEDGKTIIDVLDLNSTVRLQVIAHGFQTYGQDYKLDKAEMAFEIRMKRPGEQYSTYKPHPEENQNQQKPDSTKPQQ